MLHKKQQKNSDEKKSGLGELAPASVEPVAGESSLCMPPSDFSAAIGMLQNRSHKKLLRRRDSSIWRWVMPSIHSQASLHEDPRSSQQTALPVTLKE